MSDSETIVFEWHTDQGTSNQYQLSSKKNPYAAKVNNDTVRMFDNRPFKIVMKRDPEGGLFMILCNTDSNIDNEEYIGPHIFKIRNHMCVGDEYVWYTHTIFGIKNKGRYNRKIVIKNVDFFNRLIREFDETSS